MVLKIYTDGASRGNPGPASYSFLILEDNKEIKRKSGFIGETTNNRAEYTALIKAFKEIEGRNERVILHSDSRLLVNQMKGNWKVKSDNIKPLYRKAKELQNNLGEVEFKNVPRENTRISIVDGMCNDTLDSTLK